MNDAFMVDHEELNVAIAEIRDKPVDVAVAAQISGADIEARCCTALTAKPAKETDGGALLRCNHMIADRRLKSVDPLEFGIKDRRKRYGRTAVALRAWASAFHARHRLNKKSNRRRHRDSTNRSIRSAGSPGRPAVETFPGTLLACASAIRLASSARCLAGLFSAAARRASSARRASMPASGLRTGACGASSPGGFNGGPPKK